ncbi:predicted protein [Uncinocarpus reesii 1704]|uniref:Uncharacterized protein n=1 Tax=Uncinocarpus reesii (strain UAMH 1704) TaxID=336963 RepID=C4JR46_UNCRE|nr:uncharacterized protein UREG_03528 [Uncinocarpus reesii 1704]EEP78682.1 predicted protein [Uncinocarpus reesii 1704]
MYIPEQLYDIESMHFHPDVCELLVCRHQGTHRSQNAQPSSSQQAVTPPSLRAVTAGSKQISREKGPVERHVSMFGYRPEDTQQPKRNIAEWSLLSRTSTPSTQASASPRICTPGNAIAAKRSLVTPQPLDFIDPSNCNPSPCLPRFDGIP